MMTLEEVALIGVVILAVLGIFVVAFYILSVIRRE